MILPIKVLLEAINVREAEIKKLEKVIDDDSEGLADAFCRSDIANFEKDITILKNAVKILYYADNNERRQHGNDGPVPG